MKRLALLFAGCLGILIGGRAAAQSVDIETLSNSPPAGGGIYAKCKIKPNTRPFKTIYLVGVPSGGGRLAVANKAIPNPGKESTVELTIPNVGGQVAYEFFALINYKDDDKYVYYSSKKEGVFAKGAKDTTDYGKAELNLFELAGPGKDVAKIKYEKSAGWKATDDIASLYMFPKGGGKAEVGGIKKVAGKDEWEKNGGTFLADTAFVFGSVTVVQTEAPMGTAFVATKLKKE